MAITDTPVPIIFELVPAAPIPAGPEPVRPPAPPPPTNIVKLKPEDTETFEYKYPPAPPPPPVQPPPPPPPATTKYSTVDVTGSGGLLSITARLAAFKFFARNLFALNRVNAINKSQIQIN